MFVLHTYIHEYNWFKFYLSSNRNEDLELNDTAYVTVQHHSKHVTEESHYVD